jgi:hypothetical protein
MSTPSAYAARREPVPLMTREDARVDLLAELLIQVLQLLIQVVLQALVEAVFEAFMEGLRFRVVRQVLGGLLGVGFGLAWGQHLSGGAHWPRLLWVSLALAAVSAVLAMQRDRRADRRELTRGTLLEPPWRWPAERLGGLAIINAGIAAGIGCGFRPGVAG